MKEEILRHLFNSQKDRTGLLNPNDITQWFKKTLALVVPEYGSTCFTDIHSFTSEVKKLEAELTYFISLSTAGIVKAEDSVNQFFDQLSVLKEALDLDALAIFNEDPAAKSHEEVRYAYPSLYAISAHRIAHVLHQLEIKNLPRIIAEYAHGKTGIDIHPGAKIGYSFCIDHGTGVVIGETTVIGNHVKIYQGVTLGALSVSKSKSDTKRHPSIGNNVVIYSGATILGGKTLIGDNSIIGGNVWIVNSIPDGSKVYYEAPKHSKR